MPLPNWNRFGNEVYHKRNALRTDRLHRKELCDLIETTYDVRISEATLSRIEAGHETCIRNYLALCCWLNVHPHIYAGLAAPLPAAQSAQICADSPAIQQTTIYDVLTTGESNG